VFVPGLLSADSLDQIHHAREGVYNDWHPPVMALWLRLFYLLGLDLSHLMFVQCLLFCLGLLGLARSLLGFVTQGAMPASLQSWLGLVVLGVLGLPLSPLAHYSMTFWKDCWAALGLIWVCIFSLDLLANDSSSRLKRWLRWLGWWVAALLLGLSRHNAWVVFPFLGIVWVLLMRPIPAPTPNRANLRRLALASLPLLALLALQFGAKQLFGVQPSAIFESVMISDLLGMAKLDSSLRAELPMLGPLARWDMVDSKFELGDTAHIVWAQPRLVDLQAVVPARRAELVHEYLRTVASHPFRFLEVKLRAFFPHLQLKRTLYLVHTQIDPNRWGLEQNPASASIRQPLQKLTGQVATGPWRFFFCVHGVWLGLGLGVWACLLWRLHKNSQVREWLMFWLLCAVLGYALSFVLATTAHDFRFLYPTSLVLQVLGLSWLCLAAHRLAIATKPKQNYQAIFPSGSNASDSAIEYS